MDSKKSTDFLKPKKIPSLFFDNSSKSSLETERSAKSQENKESQDSILEIANTKEEKLSSNELANPITKSIKEKVEKVKSSLSANSESSTLIPLFNPLSFNKESKENKEKKESKPTSPTVKKSGGQGTVLDKSGLGIDLSKLDITDSEEFYSDFGSFDDYFKATSINIDPKEDFEIMDLGDEVTPRSRIFAKAKSQYNQNLNQVNINSLESDNKKNSESSNLNLIKDINQTKEDIYMNNLTNQEANNDKSNLDSKSILENIDKGLDKRPPPGKTIFAHRCEQKKNAEKAVEVLDTEGLTREYTDFYGNTRNVKLSKYYPEFEYDVEDLFKNSPVLLEGKSLNKEYSIRESLFKKTKITAVKDVDFTLKEGETLSIVGESGSGKTTLAKLITNIEDATSGKIFFKGKEVDFKNKNENSLRRKEIQVIFQNPHSSLNPRKTIFKILEEPLILNTNLSAKERRAKIEEIIELIGLKVEHLDRLPHMFSGGQKQRIAIARGLILNPSIVVADEAVSALDVSVQAQILNLMLDLQKKFNLSYIFISHDLAVVRHISHRVVVMHHGEVVETGTVDQIFNNPQHPYTKSLLAAIPKLPECSFQKEK